MSKKIKEDKWVTQFNGLRPSNWQREKNDHLRPRLRETAQLVVSAKKRVNKCQLEQYR